MKLNIVISASCAIDMLKLFIVWNTEEMTFFMAFKVKTFCEKSTDNAYLFQVLEILDFSLKINAFRAPIKLVEDCLIDGAVTIFQMIGK